MTNKKIKNQRNSRKKDNTSLIVLKKLKGSVAMNNKDAFLDDVYKKRKEKRYAHLSKEK